MKKVLSVLITAALMLQLLVMFGAVSAAGSAAMTVTDANGNVGDTVTVEVGIANNPGFHALECQIEYDKTLLELVSIDGKIGKVIPSEEDWDMLEPAFFSEVADAEFIYIDPRVDSDAHAANMVTGNEVATLTFKLLATGTSNVTVNCVEIAVYDNTAADGYRLIPTTADTGTVTIAEKPVYVLGDVTGEGFVTIADAFAIRRFLLNPEKYPLNVSEAAYVSGDDLITIADAFAIRRYLLNPEKYPLKGN